MKKLIIKPICVLCISLIAVLFAGWYVLENTRFINLEKTVNYIVSQKIKSDIKNANFKIEKEYYKSNDYKELVEKEVLTAIDHSNGRVMESYVKQMFRDMYIFYSTIVFIIGLFLSGYIKDIKNFKGKTSENEF